jgi:hypothetical protein
MKKNIIIFLLLLNISAVGQNTPFKLESVDPNHKETISTEKKVPVRARFINALRNVEKITIVTMGTSLTGGEWRWPYVMDIMMDGWLNKEYPGQTICFNEGVGNSFSSLGPLKNPALSGIGKRSTIIAHKPDIVFIDIKRLFCLR